MSSGFVSSGTLDQPIERDDDWVQAQKEIEANRRRREEEGAQEGGKSLYEVLQQNKAAKQEAFEESIRLKNQFRNLDEDEIEFLDSVLESTRAKEDALKKETAEQLSLFRRQQEEADRALLNQANDTEGGTTVGKTDDPATGDSQWAANTWKKRKRVEKEVFKGVKLRKGSSSIESSLLSETTLDEAGHAKLRPEEAAELKGKIGSVVDEKPTSYPKSVDDKAETTFLPQKDKAMQPSLGLAAYSSDEED